MNGTEFVRELIDKYGLLEGYEMAKSYLSIPYSSEDDPKEKNFREEIRMELNRVDQI